MSDWRGALGRIAPIGPDSDVAEAAPRTRLAVQFEVRESVRRGGGRWEHVSKATTAASENSAGQLTVTARPALLGSSGRWVGGNLSWPNLQHQVHQLGLDPRQVRWFSEFAALARAGGTFLGQDSVRISLDLFPSSLIWHLLAEARGLGIELVGNGKKGAAVRVGESAGIRLDASAEAGGDVRLRPLAQIDGRDVTDAALGAIGDHGLYAVSWPGPVIRLAPTDAPIGAQQLRLVDSRGIEVPASEREEFFEEFYPTIARALPVVSTDASVDVPDVPDARRSTGPESVSGDHDDDLGADADDELDFVPQDELSDTPTLKLTLVPSDQNDWFDLGFVVHVGSIEVPFAKLFAALARGSRKLRLVDKSWLALDQPVFEQLRELIEEAGGLNEWQVGVRIARQQVSLWEDFQDLADESDAAAGWRESVRALLEGLSSAEAPALPSGLVAELRPYQREGFTWLARLYEHGLGGILADDMGLGKTVQTLALMQHAVEKGGGPFLVVAPSTVVGNWVAEAARFTPGLRVAAVTTTQRKSATPLAELAELADIVVMSYAILRLDFDDIEDVRWAGLILDEAQFVKNRRSRAHECAKALPAPFKLAITGTPMENDLTELWAMFDIVAPGLFPSVRRFIEQYVRPMSHITAPASLPAGISRSDADRIIARLRRRIRPLMLRRSKEQVAPELPRKQEQVLRVDLAPRHRRLYEQFLQRERQKLLGLVAEDFDRQRFIVFRSITLLRMLALDASLIDDDYRTVPSSKLDALIEQLDDVLSEGHRALVFSQFTSYLHRVEARLEAAGIAYEYLDGSTTDRIRVVRAFTEGDAPVFLISLKAGGFGINLTQADYVFLLDPWWNPSAEAQAVDRAHRIGQDKNVMVYRIVANDTIEDKVMALRDRKADLFDAVMDDEAFAGALTADDIRGLLDL